MGFSDFLFGTSPEFEQVSQLTPQQLKLERERRRSAKGAFGQAGDYWRNILSNDPQAFAAFEAPAQRQFNEQIIPDLAEQFAGMGAGALSSSGFRNAAVGAGADLSERLASMRAGLRESAASNLYNLGQSALQPHTSYQQTSQGSQGFLAPALGAAATAAGTALGGPAGGAAANFLSSGLTNAFKGSSGDSSFGKTSPYGNSGGYQGSFGQLPNFKFG